MDIRKRYTRVEIVGIEARSLVAKRALFKAIADNLQAVGVPRKEMRIFLIEPSEGGYRIQDQRVGEHAGRMIPAKFVPISAGDRE